MKTETLHISLPCDLKYTAAVEEFIKIVLPFLDVPDPENIITTFQIALNEAFVNTVRHSTHDNALPVNVVFEYNATQLKARIVDSGKGLSVAGFYPPYPREVVGQEHVITQTVDGRIMGLVSGPDTLSLKFHETSAFQNLSRDQVIENLRPNGIGLSIITKTMDEVVFRAGEHGGNQLELVKHLNQDETQS